MRAQGQYVLRLRRRLIGYQCEFACEYPDGGDIGWAITPNSWRLTRTQAERWGSNRLADRRRSSWDEVLPLGPKDSGHESV